MPSPATPQPERVEADQKEVCAHPQIDALMEQHRFVFLGGLHRSGTSLTFRCLREHPEISGFVNTGVPEDEGQHLQSVFPKAFKYGGPAKFGFASAMSLDETSSFITPDNKRQLFEEWSRYWDMRKPYLLEKSPPNLIKSRFLQAMFPRSSFIFILRHPAAVTLATRKWRPRMRLSRILEHWLVCHERMRSDLKHLDRALVIHYEDFVAEPERVLGGIYKFIGVDTVPTSEEIRGNVNEKYFTKWREESRGLMNKLRMWQAVRRYEDRFRSFGYSLSDLSDPASSGRVDVGEDMLNGSVS